MEMNAEGSSIRSIMNSLIALLATVACFTSPGLSKPTYSGAHGGYSGIHGGYGGFAAGGGTGYHGPQALPVVLPSGHLADTPEVAAAKGAHYAALAKESAEAGPYDGGYYDGAGAGTGGYGYGGAGTVGYGYGGAGTGGYGYGGAGAGGYGISGGYSGAYHGPLASPTVLPSGYLADTHEVAALRGAHLTALSTASAVSGAGYAGGYGSGLGGGYGRGGYSGGYGGGAVGGYGGYRGPLAIPVVLPDGHIADTHEVAAAKTAHLNAVAQSSARTASHGYYGHHH